jgi:hypothetical protein
VEIELSEVAYYKNHELRIGIWNDDTIFNNQDFEWSYGKATIRVSNILISIRAKTSSTFLKPDN